MINEFFLPFLVPALPTPFPSQPSTHPSWIVRKHHLRVSLLTVRTYSRRNSKSKKRQKPHSAHTPSPKFAPQLRMKVELCSGKKDRDEKGWENDEASQTKKRRKTPSMQMITS